MASESSFDIVSKVDKQEVSNALHQAQKEISQRYDFRGVGAEIDYSGDKILIKANAEERALAVLDVFQSKLVKRGISLKSLDAGKPYASGKETRIECSIRATSCAFPPSLATTCRTLSPCSSPPTSTSTSSSSTTAKRSVSNGAGGCTRRIRRAPSSAKNPRDDYFHSSHPEDFCL